jgi:AraC family transcriptional regulator
LCDLVNNLLLYTVRGGILSEDSTIGADGNWIGQDAQNPDRVWRVERQSQIPGFDAPVASSDGAGWEGVEVEAFSLARPTPDLSICFTNLTVGMLRAGSTNLWIEHPRNSRRLEPGSIIMLPAATVLGGSNPQPLAWTAIHLKPSLLATAAHDPVNLDRVDIIPDVVFREPQIERLLLALEAEARSGFVSGRLFGEALGLALAVHLLGHYAGGAGTPRQYRGGMTRYQLRRTIDYIRANLGHDLGVAELAAQAEMSHWHFCRMFKRTTGLSPHQFLMRERIEAAKMSLAKPDVHLALIARDLGFADQSHFTMVFRRFTGMTPRRYLRSL